jgi:hypothetical protein
MLLIAEKCGRLGNRLLQFSHLIAFCAEYGAVLHNPAFEDYAMDFFGSAGACVPTFPKRSGVIARFLPRRGAFLAANIAGRLARRYRLNNALIATTTTLGDTPEFDVDPADPNVRQALMGSTCVFVFGWRYRNDELFHKHQEVIRRYFRPIERIQRQIDTCLHNLREHVDVVVGVHIRQGDYRTYLSGQYYFPTSVYACYMRRWAEQLQPKRVGFVVCSDQTQDPDFFAGLCWTLGVGNPVADVYSLAACDYIIAVPSTFSRWASFYGRVPLFMLRSRADDIQAGSFAIAQN